MGNSLDELTKLSYKKLASLIEDVYDYQHEFIVVKSDNDHMVNKEASIELNNIIIALAFKTIE